MIFTILFAALFLCGALLALVLPAFLVQGAAAAVLWGIACLAAYLVLAELLFRAAYWLRTGSRPERFPSVPFEQIHVEPHPYIPYVYKKDFTPESRRRKSAVADYPLHAGRFRFPEVHFNNFRLINGPGADRDVEMPKPEGRFRVLCLGASTTGNYIEEDGALYSYPNELEKELRSRRPDLDVEVVNGGVGGRTSAEILIHFLLDLVDIQPDAVVLYHAYNDLGPSMTPGFQPDYSHARKNLGETYHLYRARSRFPDIPSSLYHYFLNRLFPGTISNSLLNSVTLAPPDTDAPFQGLATYERNLRHLLDVCRARDITPVLATFCHYLHPGIADSPEHRKYGQGVREENRVMRGLADAFGARLADAAEGMPQEDEFFVDSIHFTPRGMTRLARLVAEELEAVLP